MRLVWTIFNLPLKRTLKVRFFIIFICAIFALFLNWTPPVFVSEHSDIKKLAQEALGNVANDFRYSEVYRKASKQSKDLKYILIWKKDERFFEDYEEGQRSLIKYKCSVKNCYVTRDRMLFNGSLTKFDAIAFHGNSLDTWDLPKQRSPHQKYIYSNSESADNYPVCSSVFDDFFNWTFSYRLDSDILNTYILMRNRQRMIIGPKIKMHWPDDLPKVSKDLAGMLMNKTKAAAWFVSHCHTRSGREHLVEKLQKILARYGYKIDVCGKCGPLSCSEDCHTQLDKDYFFYMSLENSFAQDYVTEKLLTALQHNTVPIVYGGADYSRFLPPGSYINARKLSINDLAALMVRLMNSPKLYSQYFRWKSQYTYFYPDIRNWSCSVCPICAALNNKEMMEKVSVYPEFRKWWNPDFQNRCSFNFF